MGTEPTSTTGGTGGGNDGGQQFQAITSQEALDRIIGERVARERGKYADYDDLKAKAAKFDEAEAANQTELQKITARAEAAEQKVAKHEAEKQVATWAAEITKGSTIPAAALRGSTKEELTEHFEVLKSIAPAPQQKRGTPPGKAAGDDGKSGSRAVEALRELRRG